MHCPKCNADYLKGDNFCISCGNDLRHTEENIPGKILLKEDALAGIAGSHPYTALSPLAGFYQGPAEMKPVTMEPSILNAILQPERAFYVIELTGNSFQQEVLLVKESSFHLWKEKDSAASISREAGPREFIERTKTLLAQCISNNNTSLISIKQKSLRTLAAVAALCKALSGINEAASFVTISHLESFVGGGEGLPAEIKELSRQGFIRCIGAEEPLIVLEQKGGNLLSLLNEYDRFFILQILTEGVPDYPSLHLAAWKGSLCLITKPKGSDDLVIRALDAEGMKSLIDWAWTTTL
jgi:hypothetical protein